MVEWQVASATALKIKDGGQVSEQVNRVNG